MTRPTTPAITRVLEPDAGAWTGDFWEICSGPAGIFPAGTLSGTTTGSGGTGGDFSSRGDSTAVVVIGAVSAGFSGTVTSETFSGVAVAGSGRDTGGVSSWGAGTFFWVFFADSLNFREPFFTADFSTVAGVGSIGVPRVPACTGSGAGAGGSAEGGVATGTGSGIGAGGAGCAPTGFPQVSQNFTPGVR